MKRRTLAALCGMMLAALWATPAWAVSTPVFQKGPEPGQVAKGSVEIQVKSDPSSIPILGLGLERVSIEVKITPRSGTAGEAINFGKKEGSVYTATWNAGGAPYNGAFDITAIAHSSAANQDSKQTTIANVMVNNAPAVPSGVKATLQEGVPVISWTANAEKDITGYRVLRSIDGGNFTQLVLGPKTTYTDTSAPHSQALTYSVVAIRRSPVNEGGVASGQSAATSALTVPAPPAPEPALNPDGSPVVDPEAPTVPGTNIVTGVETPPPPPKANPNFGKAIAPIVKAAPQGTAFEPTLPYTGTPPERFESATGGQPSLIEAQEAANGGGGVTNPAMFVLGGLALLAASGLMWKTSRKLLRGIKSEDPGALPPVNFPAFRINRT